MDQRHSNFEFLDRLDRELANLGKLAESYFQDDPSTSLIKLRQFGERLTRRHAALVGSDVQYGETQADVLRRLQYERSAPDRVLDVLHHIRKLGNAAVHDGAGNHREALACLKMAVQLGVWHVRTSSAEKDFATGPFLPPSSPQNPNVELQQELERLRVERNETLSAAQRAEEAHREALLAAETAEARHQREQEERKTWEALAHDADRQLRDFVEQSQRQAPAAKMSFVTAANEAAGAIDLDEQATRALIDQQLRDRGWDAHSVELRYGKGKRPVKGRHMAIAEWPTQSGPADYALFVGETCVGMVEAKRYRKNVSAAVDQAERYSKGLSWPANSEVWGDGFVVPFVFATNGRPYLKQVVTESGIWFRDVRLHNNLRRALTGWFRPEELISMLEVEKEKAQAALQARSFDFGFDLRPYQEAAIREVEKTLATEKREMLVAMATGTGKTKLAIAMLYRLLATKRFRRICFVVDRSALGTQTTDEFMSTAIEGPKTFGQLFGIKGLEDIKPDPETRVHICTIQGLVKRVLYNAEPSDVPPIGQYDLMVIDECHRGYLLDREMSDAELSFRGQEDYVSKYRRVLEHFDAVKIGLTATPALHTAQIFGDPIFTYTYREAVVDGWLIDHEPPIRFQTALAKAGITFEAGEDVELLDSQTGEVQNATAPDEFCFQVEAFNRKVITQPFNQVIAEELAKHIDPSLEGKTLVFAATDAHADIVVNELKKAFAAQYGSIEDAAIRKITGSVDKVGTLIRSFRNDAFPQIAVTVDLLTTGIDVPKITNLVFIRRVNSRILYEQMLGRATRRCDDIGKEVFRIFDAVDLYATLQDLTQMKPVASNPKLTFEQLFDELATVTEEDQRELVRDQVLAKLHRKLRKLPSKVAQMVEDLTGETVEQLRDRLRQGSPSDAAAHAKKYTGLGKILDWNPDGSGPNLIPISHHEDSMHAVITGYGQYEKPEDFLDTFRFFVRNNQNQIAALTVVVQRPRDLTRAELRSLRLELDKMGFSETSLRRAWNDASNEDIAASIIGFVRQAALGDPLIPFETRVQQATKAILAKAKWTDPQKQWLRRIAEQITKEIVLDRDSIDHGNFAAHGGFTRLNKVFNGQLETILHDFNEELWEDKRMNPNTADIVAKLWREAKTLQGAGISIMHYVNELTYLLFLKMLEETGQTALIPSNYSWTELSKTEGGDQLRYYKKLLLDLGDPEIVHNPMVQAIFTDAITHLREPKDLKTLTTNIDKIDWFTAREDGLGDMYEGLMQKVMSDTKSKAGQYFTPRALIDSIIRLIQPQPGEIIQDPAAGTAGFLIAADRYIKDATDDLFKLTEAQGQFQRHRAFRGHEWVPDTRRLCVMNMLLHGIDSLVGCEDSCAPQGANLGNAHVILTNPPFNKMPGGVNRPDFTLTAGERVGPMPFLEHAIRMLKPGGRCAIVMPDNILFGDGTGTDLRRFLMVNCNLHTILRLPTGIFYAQGVKTNVMFFTRVTDKVYPANHKVQGTQAVWFYDLRTNMPSFGKTNALTAGHFEEFERLFGPDPKGGSDREEGGEGGAESGRWRKLTRDQIAARGDNLDWTWLRDESGDPEDEMTEPDEIAAAIMGHLRAALEEIEGLAEELDAAPQALSGKPGTGFPSDSAQDETVEAAE